MLRNEYVTSKKPEGLPAVRVAVNLITQKNLLGYIHNPAGHAEFAFTKTTFLTHIPLVCNASLGNLNWAS